MTDIIYLENEEELPTLIERLERSSGTNVILVIPRGCTLLQSIVNLKLLQSQAQAKGKTIALVTQDPIGRNLAAQLGISVFENIDATKPLILPSRPNPKPDEVIEIDFTTRKIDQPKGVKVHHFQEGGVLPGPIAQAPVLKPKEKRKLKAFILGTILTLICGAVLFYIFLPRATITLAMKTQSYQSEMELLITNTGGLDLSKKTIPGQMIEASSEKSQKFPATGEKDVGAKAKGTVTIYNKTGASQTVGTGAKLRSSSGLNFLTQKEVSVPAGTASIDSQGNVSVNPGKVGVDVEAESAGDQYNISATNFTITSLSSSLQANVYAQSTSSFSGGSSQKVKVVKKDDLDKAKSTLVDMLSIQNKEELTKKTTNFYQIENAIENTVLEESYSAKKDQEVAEFEAKIKVKSQTLGVKNKVLQDSINELTKESIGSQKQLLLPEKGGITLEVVRLQLEEGKMVIKAKINGKIMPALSEDALKKAVKGKSISSAEAYLKNLPDIDKVKVDLYPNFFKFLPRLTTSIKIKWEYQ
jgi:hypothetical protein